MALELARFRGRLVRGGDGNLDLLGVGLDLGAPDLLPVLVHHRDRAPGGEEEGERGRRKRKDRKDRKEREGGKGGGGKGKEEGEGGEM